MSFSRSFRIRAPRLSRAVQLVLVFEPLDKTLLYNDQFPTAWKVIKFPAGTYGDSGSIVFKNSLAVATATINSANIVLAGSAADAGQGDMFSMTSDSSGVLSIKKTDNAGGALISVENDTDSIQDVSFGFIQADVFNCVQVQTAVGAGLSATFQYTPKLKIYLTSNYQESEVVRSEIRSKPLWDKDLGATPTTFSLNLIEGANGSYTISQGAQTTLAISAPPSTGGGAAGRSSPNYRPVLLAEYEQSGGSVWRFYGEAPTFRAGGHDLAGRTPASSLKKIPRKLLEYRAEVLGEEEEDNPQDAGDDDVLSDQEEQEEQEETLAAANNYWAKAAFNLGGPVLATAFTTWAYSRFQRTSVTITSEPTTGQGTTFTVNAQGASEQTIRDVIAAYNASRNADVPTGNPQASPLIKGKAASAAVKAAATAKVVSVDVKSNISK